LQISNYWDPAQPGPGITINLTPGQTLADKLVQAKKTSKRKLSNELTNLLPARLADTWLAIHPEFPDRVLPDCKDRDLQQLAHSLQSWAVQPSGTEGYRKAEVTLGGVNTRELHSSSMQSQRQAGLFFIGEVVDVTGWLGGYNFQWAWASAAACARAMAA
jgi:predicted Rossmann fold flavoprotein